MDPTTQDQARRKSPWWMWVSERAPNVVKTHRCGPNSIKPASFNPISVLFPPSSRQYISKNMPATERVIRPATEGSFPASHASSRSHNSSTRAQSSTHRCRRHRQAWTLDYRMHQSQKRSHGNHVQQRCYFGSPHLKTSDFNVGICGTLGPCLGVYKLRTFFFFFGFSISLDTRNVRGAWNILTAFSLTRREWCHHQLGPVNAAVLPAWRHGPGALHTVVTPTPIGRACSTETRSTRWGTLRTATGGGPVLFLWCQRSVGSFWQTQWNLTHNRHDGEMHTCRQEDKKNTLI